MKRWKLFKTKSVDEASKFTFTTKPQQTLTDLQQQQTHVNNEDNPKESFPTKNSKSKHSYSHFGPPTNQENLDDTKMPARNISVSRSGRYKEKSRARVRMVSIDGDLLVTSSSPSHTKELTQPSQSDIEASKDIFHLFDTLLDGTHDQSSSKVDKQSSPSPSNVSTCRNYQTTNEPHHRPQALSIFGVDPSISQV